jgi:IPT/TIG domain
MNLHRRDFMKIRDSFARVIGAAIAAAGLLSSPIQAAGLPLVISATVNYSQKTLNISGQNFGSSPSVTVNSTTIPTLSSASNQIVARFPDATPPSSFVPGTYFLTIQSKNQLPAIFTVDVGANGAPGPAGSSGPSGPQGAAVPLVCA